MMANESETMEEGDQYEIRGGSVLTVVQVQESTNEVEVEWENGETTWEGAGWLSIMGSPVS